MMNALRTSLNKRLHKLAVLSKDKMDYIIIGTTCAGWVASSAAQVIGIATNKDYTFPQKKYMIAQEVADAATNIGLYLAVTTSMRFLVLKMVKTGKLTPKSIAEFIENNPELKRNRGKFDFDITDHLSPTLKNTYDSFYSFAGVATATAGGIVASNVITPIVRNSFAAYRQNKFKQTHPEQPKPTQPAVRTPHTSFDTFRTNVLSI